MPLDSPQRLLAIVGPTAVGKTALAVQLAERVDCEVVNADSRQLYRGMDIGTAKPTPDERAKVRHHLIDLAEPDEPFTILRFGDGQGAVYGLAIGDVDGDGRPDIVAARSGAPNMLYLN